jgi:hypothetical protein
VQWHKADVEEPPANVLWVWDPTRINDHDVRRKPVIVVVNGVVDPIAVVVDLRLRQLHAGKDQTGRRLGQFLARLYLLHLHASGAYADDFTIVDFCEDVGLADRVDLMFAVLLDLFAKQSFPIEVLFLLGECDARGTDGGAGTLRCLAVTGEGRWPDLPDVPTMVEAGYKDFVFATDTVLLAPSQTPPEAVNWLESETLRTLSTPDMKEKLYKSGFQVRPKGAKDAWTRVTKEIEMFKEVIEQAGIKKL